MDLLRANKYLLICLVASATLSLFFGSWPLLLFAFYTIAKSLPLPKKLSSVVVFRAFLSIMLVLSLVQIEAVLFYAVHVKVDAFVYNLLNAFLATLVFVRYGGQKFRFSTDDIIILVVPLIVVAAPVASMLSVAHKSSVDIAILQKITSSSDESAHLNLFATQINNGSNIPNMSYPAGWHTATSVVVSSFVNLKDNNFQDTVRAYWVMKMFTIFLAVMALISLFVMTSRSILRNNKPYYILFSLIAMFLSGITIIPNMEINAFFNYVAQYIYVLLCFTFIFAIDNNKKMTYACLAVLTAAATASWVLLGLILGVIISVVLLSNAKKIYDSKIVRLLWQPAVGLMIVAGVIILATNNVFSAQFDKLEHPEGWIETFNFSLYGVLALLWFLLRFYKNTHKDLGKAVIAVDTYFLVIAGLVVATILRQYGSVSYYFIKMMMPIVLVVVPFLVVEFVSITEKNKIGKLFPYAVLILLALSINNVIGTRIISLTGKSILNQTYLHKTSELSRAKQLSNIFSNNKFNSYGYVYAYNVDSDTTLDQMVYQLISASIYNRDNDIYETCAVRPSGGYYGGDSYQLGILSKNYAQNGCIERLKIIVSVETYAAAKQYVSDKNIILINQ